MQNFWTQRCISVLVDRPLSPSLSFCGKKWTICTVSRLRDRMSVCMRARARVCVRESERGGVEGVGGKYVSVQPMRRCPHTNSTAVVGARQPTSYGE